MWGNDGRGSPLPFSSGMPGRVGRRAPGEPLERMEYTEYTERMERPRETRVILPDVASAGVESMADVADVADVEDMESEDDAADVRMELPGGAAEVDSPAWRRAPARQQLREFLRSMPRSEPNEATTFLRPDGEPRTVTRAEVSAALDCMRPRMRRIIYLAVEQRWPRKRVCEHLGISIKTYERDHVEALDMLVNM